MHPRKEKAFDRLGPATSCRKTPECMYGRVYFRPSVSAFCLQPSFVSPGSLFGEKGNGPMAGLSPVTKGAQSKLHTLRDQGSTVLPELRRGRCGTCRKDSVQGHLGGVCHNCGGRNSKKKQKCLRKTEGWPGLGDDAQGDDARVEGLPLSDAADIHRGSVATRGLSTDELRASGKAPSSKASRPAHLRQNPPQTERLDRHTDSGKKQRQGARKRGRDAGGSAVCTQRRKLRYGLGTVAKKAEEAAAEAARQEKARGEIVAVEAAAAAAQVAAEEEELLGGEISYRQVSWVVPCRGLPGRVVPRKPQTPLLLACLLACCHFRSASSASASA